MEGAVILLVFLLLGAAIFVGWQSYGQRSYYSLMSCPLDMIRKNPDEVPFAERVLVNLPKHAPARSQASTPQKIPRRIMQTNEREMVPAPMKEAIDKLLAINPEYEYEYFTDADALEFIKTHFPHDVLKAYKKVNPGAFKADLFRYCYLYVRGGVYLDTGMNAVKPLREIIRADDTFISAEDNGHKAIYNAIIMAIPEHPIIKTAIDDSVKTILAEEYGHEMLYVTGPGRLRWAFEKVMKKTPLSDTDYGEGVRLIKHTARIQCICGLISQDGVLMLYTKYPRYPRDQVWYNTKKHYGALWYEKKIYLPDSELELI